MDADAVAHPFRGSFAAGIVRGDDEGFVPGPVQMFKNPQHRIRDTVDVGKERLGDYGNAHSVTMRRSHVGEVAARDMSSVQSESIGTQPVHHSAASSGAYLPSSATVAPAGKGGLRSSGE